MRIGIDIDNTMTKIKDRLLSAAIQYAESLNKKVSSEQSNITDLYNDGSVYQKLFNFNYDELKYFLGTIQEEITNSAIPRKTALK